MHACVQPSPNTIVRAAATSAALATSAGQQDSGGGSGSGGPQQVAATFSSSPAVWVLDLEAGKAVSLLTGEHASAFAGCQQANVVVGAGVATGSRRPDLPAQRHVGSPQIFLVPAGVGGVIATGSSRPDLPAQHSAMSAVLRSFWCLPGHWQGCNLVGLRNRS